MSSHFDPNSFEKPYALIILAGKLTDYFIVHFVNLTKGYSI